MTGRIVLILWIGLFLPLPGFAVFPPLAVDIIDSGEKIVAKALIYSKYIELLDTAERKRGAVGVVRVEGRMRLFLVEGTGERKLVGYSENRRLFDAQGKLLGFYQWTPIWSYVYDKSMKKMGKAQCLAYQGLCAAAVAGVLLGLF